MNLLQQTLFNKVEQNVFNAITHGNVLQDDLIFSDRHFLTQQILWERLLYGNKGFNEISDYYILHLAILGKIKSLELQRQLNKIGDNKKSQQKQILKDIKNNRINALKNEIGYFEEYINRIKGLNDFGDFFLIWIAKELIKAKKVLIKKIEKKYIKLNEKF